MNPNTHTWSQYQETIFDNTAHGKGHTVVIARAGTGKTTTILEALKHVPAKCKSLLVAFNKAIATEMKERLTEQGTTNAEARTLHSYGFSACRWAFGQVAIDNDKCWKLLNQRLGTNSKERKNLVRGYRPSILRIVSLAKNCLAGSPEGLEQIIDDFEIDCGGINGERSEFIGHCLWLLETCKRNTNTLDFDDMIWLPVVHDLKCWQFDRVFIDETQDLNACQIELALKACKRRGRICAVGDDRQAIYGFRGADTDAINNLIKRLNAKVLPLSITYRCAKSIASLARQYVADYTAHENNQDGSVKDCDGEQELASLVRYGDFILSRSNAPLVSLCLRFLTQGKAAVVKGREIGESLTALVKRSEAKETSDFQAWLGTWAQNEVKRLESRDPPGNAEGVFDKVACLESLAEGTQLCTEILARIETCFAENDRDRIILSSTHKAKGLERDRVFMLADTYLKRPSIEESNLYYVAVTRARNELFLVRGIS
jgi:superfamily I DNA/RNA helicase